MSHDGLQLSIGWKVRGNYKRKFLSDVGEHSVVWFPWLHCGIKVKSCTTSKIPTIILTFNITTPWNWEVFYTVNLLMVSLAVGTYWGWCQDTQWWHWLPQQVSDNLLFQWSFFHCKLILTASKLWEASLPNLQQGEVNKWKSSSGISILGCEDRQFDEKIMLKFLDINIFIKKMSYLVWQNIFCTPPKHLLEETWVSSFIFIVCILF